MLIFVAAKTLSSVKARQFLKAKSYLEMEAPMLTKAAPEGACDYLVLSRVHLRSFLCAATVTTAVQAVVYSV